MFQMYILTHPLDPNCDKMKAAVTKVAGPKQQMPFALRRDKQNEGLQRARFDGCKKNRVLPENHIQYPPFAS